MPRLRPLLPSLALLSFVLTPHTTIAEEERLDLVALIDAVVAAYGGDALTSLSGYEITESYVAPNAGQSWHPDLTDIGRFNFRLVHDLENNHIYQESWFNSPGGRFPNITIVNDEGAWNVNLLGNRYGEAANSDPYAIAGGIMRTTDTLLARELLRSREDAQHLGTTQWRNRDHEQVRIPFPQSPDLTLYIDRESQLISRMSRENPQIGTLDYVFSGHQVVDGVTTAGSVNFSVAGAPNLLGTARNVNFNQPNEAGIFDLPAGLDAEGERVDDSGMVVNRLADSVYHIGQNGGYSVFVDTGREVIGAGGYPGLTQRLARFREETGNFRPLAYQVVTHHHQDHLGGMDEAVAMGATLVTVADTVSTLRDNSSTTLADERFLLVDERLTLGVGDGEVQLFDVSTNHSASNLLVYLRSQRILFMADHFGNPFAEGITTANSNTASMAAALAPLELDIRRIVTAHNGRVYSKKDFDAAVEAYTPFPCPADRPLCSL